ncbi:MAG: hypothetical protein KC561_08530, partial [Myxococcales bacterium]|nr:hypothetical protein [Myxococcales bacterium]
MRSIRWKLPSIRLIANLCLMLGALGAAGFIASCADEEAPAMASARVINSRAELIGGQSAIGAPGDYILENDRIRLIIQDAGFSRVAGVFGGQLLDVDLRRPQEDDDSAEPNGFDAFGELFPVLFTQAVAVDEVQIISDGSDGGPAIVQASGYGGDVFTFLSTLNRAATGSNANFQNPDSDPQIRYDVVYTLRPGA